MRRALALGALAALVVCAAVWAAPAGPRLVSLAPHLTELVYAAGAGDLLVATVEYSDYPAGARRLPRVGDAWRVDMEQLLALAPDVVLTWASGTPDDVVERLRALGLAHREIATYRLADVSTALRTIGTLAGTSALADAAATDFEREIAELRRRYAHARPLRVFIQLDDQPVYTVNGRHIISEVVELCGGRNVFADLPQLAPPVSLEAVIAEDPEVIVSTDDTIADPLAMWRRWQGVRAVRAGAVYSLPADLMARATPRLAAGTRATCAALDEARKSYRELRSRVLSFDSAPGQYLIDLSVGYPSKSRGLVYPVGVTGVSRSECFSAGLASMDIYCRLRSSARQGICLPACRSGLHPFDADCAGFVPGSPRAIALPRGELRRRVEGRRSRVEGRRSRVEGRSSVDAAAAHSPRKV